MYDAIKNFSGQFKYEPEIVNGENLKKFNRFIVAGMGGSHLAADILKTWNPFLKLIVHKDYALPALSEDDLKETLVIASSYSGNTEETLDALKKALEKNLAVAAVSTGGKLIEIAEKEKIPYIKMPDTGIQPRSALGFSLKSLLKLMGEEEALNHVTELSRGLVPSEYEEEGRNLAEKLSGRVPVIYSSERNYPIAYNWKIKLNETGKIPAFTNVFPELNHNEMTGFDSKKATKDLSKSFHFILLRDANDEPRIKKRMDVFEKLFTERNLLVESIELKGRDTFHKIFSSLILADWTAYFTAQEYGVEAEQVPMVEEFKKLI